MRTIHLKSAMFRTALAAIVLLSASATALAQQVVNLTAAPTSTTLPDGNVVPMWGYSCGSVSSGSTATCVAANPAVAAAQAAVAAATPTAPASAAQTALAASWSPVIITVPSGEGLTINLSNQLSFTPSGATSPNTIPTSLVIVGQIGGGLGGDPVRTKSPDHSTVRAQTWPIATGATTDGTLAPSQADRVQSFGTEVVATGRDAGGTAGRVGQCADLGQPATGHLPDPLRYAPLDPGTDGSVRDPGGDRCQPARRLSCGRQRECGELRRRGPAGVRRDRPGAECRGEPGGQHRQFQRDQGVVGLEPDPRPARPWPRRPAARRRPRRPDAVRLSCSTAHPTPTTGPATRRR